MTQRYCVVVLYNALAEKQIDLPLSKHVEESVYVPSLTVRLVPRLHLKVIGCKLKKGVMCTTSMYRGSFRKLIKGEGGDFGGM